jgi:hypothetical protein
MGLDKLDLDKLDPSLKESFKMFETLPDFGISLRSLCSKDSPFSRLPNGCPRLQFSEYEHLSLEPSIWYVEKSGRKLLVTFFILRIRAIVGLLFARNLLLPGKNGCIASKLSAQAYQMV